jgi:hypothetical protein
MARSLVFLACGAALLALSAPGCTGKDPYAPGEPLGTFKVTGTLVSSTCGATPNPWLFDVKLRHQATTTLYWVQGDAPISGMIDPLARSIMKASDTRTVREADAKKKLAACNMVREDTVDLVLSPVVTPVTDVKPATTFKGTLKYRFSVTEGSQCEDQLTESGGDFATLPCEVSYELGAQKIEGK